jgi:uncharacterized protein (DUF1015 family)
MADVRPFPGIRFADPNLTRALCPPYDVIGPEQAARLRAEPGNAIHLELPSGYDAAAALWSEWLRRGVLRSDKTPGVYVIEERFGKKKRTGFLAALGVRDAILPHERTLSKHKEDRAKLLEAVRVNLSPIFGVFHDAGAKARRVLSAQIKRKPDASGTLEGTAYKLWRVTEEKSVSALCKAMAKRPVLIADGHHRFEVCKAFGAETIMSYFCAEEDPGLVVLPTHRVVAQPTLPAAQPRKPVRTLGVLLSKLKASRNPYAFGLYEGGKLFLCEPKPQGCRSGLCVEWLAKRLVAELDPHDIRYTPEAAKAHSMAKEAGGCAVFVKPFAVAQIRKAVAKVGLLPQKSTYFFPKVATGLVFKAL